MTTATDIDNVDRNGIDGDSAKRRKISLGNNHTGHVSSKQELVGYHPVSFVTWNCNGFSTRAHYDRDKLERLVRETQNPDVICIQEARLKAEGPRERRGRPLKDKDHEHVKISLAEPFCHYTPFWSLADKKYAGTLTLVKHSCLEASGSSPISNTMGKYDPDLVAFSPSSAINLLLRRFGKTRSECGLTEVEGESSTSGKVSQPKKQQQQTSLRSFFAPKKKEGSADAVAKTKRDHNPEGRFQFFFFPGMDLVQTYTPNNGTKEESFDRRKEWDRSMKNFVKERKQILRVLSQKSDNGSSDGSGGIKRGIDSGVERKFLWCGDLNVAATYRDGSHWEKRGPKREKGSSNQDRTEGSCDTDDSCTIYEWFRDESKCLGKAEYKSAKSTENVGIPGFTPAERERFAAFLDEGDFCDLWRNEHPEGVTSDDNKENPWERPNYTWRGTCAKNFGGYAKYEGKGQRIDYFLLSPSKLGAKEVQKCEIRGYGTRREGLFCGSDHCAVELRLGHVD